MLLNVFLQAFHSDIRQLPTSLRRTNNLLPELLSDSRAESTSKTYYNGFMNWKMWSLENGLKYADIFPANAFYVALYLCSLIEVIYTSSPVLTAFCSF